MGKAIVLVFACLALVLVLPEAGIAEGWAEQLGKAIGKQIGKQVAAEMAEQALRELMRTDDTFRGFVEALQAGQEVCDDLDREYGSGTCANVMRRLLK